MKEAYKVSLPAYEGPLDLLLYLIRKAEVDIYDIPIAQITREYLEYVTLMQELQLELAGDFFVMAATLMLIKSQMLLPRPVTTELESIEDPRTELMRQLIEYERIQKLSDEMRELEDMEAGHFARGVEKTQPEQPSLANMSLFDLLNALQQVLANAKPEPTIVIDRESLRIEDAMERIHQRLLAQPEGFFFTDLLDKNYTRLDVLITFISVLELCHLRKIRMRQMRSCGPITVVAA